MRAKLLQRLAADYEAMFTPLITLMEKIGGSDEATSLWATRKDGQPWTDPVELKAKIAAEVAWAKRILKKTDRIVWYLRWLKLSLEKVLTPDEQYQKTLAQYIAKAKGTVEPFVTAPYLATQSARNNFHVSMEHFLSLPIPEIQNYQPGYKTIREVQNEWELIWREWKEGRKNIVSPQEGDKLVLDCGDGLAWWLLDRNMCSEEGDAMGHCGNGGSQDKNERILSLRKNKQGQDWEPHATFILSPNGMLGEMKGKENKKPVAKYYPAIVKLLMSDQVKGIVGGGYLAENNFAVTDLAPELREELYTTKPQLMTAPDYFQKHGVDRVLIEKVIDYFDQQHGEEDISYDSASKMFVTRRWNSMADLAYDRGDRGARWAMDIIEGGRTLAMELDYYDQALQMLEALPTVDIQMIGRMLQKKYPEQVTEYEEEHGGYNPDASEDVMTLARQVEYTNLNDALSIGYEAGVTAGAQKEILGHLHQAIREASYYGKPRGAFEEWRTPEFMIGLIARSSSFEAGNQEEIVRLGNIEDQYWLDSFDEDAAITHFRNVYDLPRYYDIVFGAGAAKQFKEKWQQEDAAKWNERYASIPPGMILAASAS